MNIRNVISKIKEYQKSDAQSYTVREMVSDLVTKFIEERTETFKNKPHIKELENSLEFEERTTFARKVQNFKNSLVKILAQAVNHEDNCFEIYWCTEFNAVTIEEEIITTIDGDLISSEARDDHYFTCVECDELHHNDNRFSYYESDDFYCETCHDNNGTYCDYHEDHHHDDHTCDASILCEWDDKVDLFFLRSDYEEHKQDHELEFYGIEVELHTRSESFSRHEVVTKLMGTFDNDEVMFKRDGSLCRINGFEMVSTNCTFDFHKNHFWNEFFALNPNEYVKAWHGKECGIHIHCSRESFTENQLRRLNVFYNHISNTDFIEKMSCRDLTSENSTTYVNFRPERDFNSPLYTSGPHNKYSVINFNNTDTFEIRIFRSNIKQISFFRYLEFVHTVNLWIKSNDKSDDSNLLVVDYLNWLIQNVHKDFSNLLIYFDDKQEFEHLKYIEEWKPIYLNFKTIVHDFRTDNSELINQELESENN